MKRYSIADARANLPSLIDEVEGGKEVELTRRGKPVAIVVSKRDYDRMRPGGPRFGDLYREFLQRYSLSDIGIESQQVNDLRDQGEGRRVDL